MLSRSTIIEQFRANNQNYINSPTSENLNILVKLVAEHPVLFFGWSKPKELTSYEKLIDLLVAHHDDGYKLHFDLYKKLTKNNIYSIHFLFLHRRPTSYKLAIGKIQQAYYDKTITLKDFIEFFMNLLEHLPFNKVTHYSESNYICHLLTKLAKSHCNPISVAIFHLSEKSLLLCFDAIDLAILCKHMTHEQAQDLLLAPNANGETPLHHIIQAQPQLLTRFLACASQLSLYSETFHRRKIFHKDGEPKTRADSFLDWKGIYGDNYTSYISLNTDYTDYTMKPQKTHEESFLDWIEIYGDKVVLKNYIDHLYQSFPNHVAQEILYEQAHPKRQYRLFEKQLAPKNTMTDCLLTLSLNRRYDETLHAAVQYQLTYGLAQEPRWPNLNHLKDYHAKFFKPFESKKKGQPATTPKGVKSPPDYSITSGLMKCSR